MAFQINGQNVTFSSATFTKMVDDDGGKLFRWKTSSMGPIRDLVTQNASGTQVRTALLLIKGEKLSKYKRGIKYLVYHYPGIVTGINNVAPVLVPARNTFQAALATMKSDDFADLVYGIASARALAPYTPSPGNSRPRFCDDFNNAANIGTGVAFERAWNGYGTLGATPGGVAAKIQTSSATQDKMPQNAMDVYSKGLLNSKYSPSGTFNADAGRLTPNTHQNLTRMKEIHGNGAGLDHTVMHARFVLSVRRACKGGIAMVASDPSYRRANAQIQFVLDQLGDLGSMAFKEALAGKGDYLPVTSSELSFCFRYWNHPNHPLNGIVKFYVNGERVVPPWEGNWSKQDAAGTTVTSNQEAWLRYGLFRQLTSDTGKAFPAWRADDN